MLKAAIILILGFIFFLLIFFIISPTCDPNSAMTTAKNTLPN